MLYIIFCANNTLEDSPPQDEPYMTELSLTITEVQATLEALDVTKATGPDGISAYLLKETDL